MSQFVDMLFKPWTQARLTFIDTETTSAERETAHVVQLGIAFFREGKCVQVKEKLVQPPEGVVINQEASKIHGIVDASLQDCPTMRDVISELGPYMTGGAPAAYCADFDRQVLANSMRGVHLFGAMPWIDPLVFVRMADRYIDGAGRHTLTSTCERYGVKLRRAHSAGADARAAGELLFALLDKGVLQADWTLAELLTFQRKKALRQEREFQAYKAKMAKDDG